jgi:hypothetical protein
MKDKQKKPIDEPRKVEREFSFDDATVIWKYNYTKSISNPYEVEVKYKRK